MSSLNQTAMFISGDVLVMVVPQLTNPSGPMLLSLRGHRSMTHLSNSLQSTLVIADTPRDLPLVSVIARVCNSDLC